MLPVRITFHLDAQKNLRGMPRSVATNIIARLEAIAADPAGLAARRHPSVKAFGRGIYRVRVTKWRAVFQIEGDEMVVLVVDSREDVYR